MHTDARTPEPYPTKCSRDAGQGTPGPARCPDHACHCLLSFNYLLWLALTTVGDRYRVDGQGDSRSLRGAHA